jgi:methionyl-tRNA formyltransferase
VQAAILSGDEETGVTTMWMTEKLDEGPIFASRRVPIGADEDAGSLTDRLAALGAGLLVETLHRIERGEIVRHAQDSSRATYSGKLTREDARLSLRDDPGAFARRVRAFAPRPGAFLTLEGGESLIVQGASIGASSSAAVAGTLLALDPRRGMEVALVQGSVWIGRVRPSGRKEMGGFDYANGARVRPGARLPVKEETA